MDCNIIYRNSESHATMLFGIINVSTVAHLEHRISGLACDFVEKFMDLGMIVKNRVAHLECIIC